MAGCHRFMHGLHAAVDHIDHFIGMGVQRLNNHNTRI